jgi:hypothetical protein
LLSICVLHISTTLNAGAFILLFSLHDPLGQNEIQFLLWLLRHMGLKQECVRWKKVEMNVFFSLASVRSIITCCGNSPSSNCRLIKTLAARCSGAGSLSACNNEAKYILYKCALCIHTTHDPRCKMKTVDLFCAN